MKRIEPIILVAAVGFYALAMTSQGVLPLLEKEVTRPTTLMTIDGRTVPTPKRDALEAEGRRIYIREGCWYCHSQYIRPVNRDTDKWGPVTQSGEISNDLPQMFGTRRIGPELSREGNRRTDEWHYAHHWNPRSTEPESSCGGSAGSEWCLPPTSRPECPSCGEVWWCASGPGRCSFRPTR